MIFSIRRTAVAAAFLSSSALSSTAIAQMVEDDSDAAEEIIITGTPIRDSQAAALERKKNAVNVLDIISADFIGRFPDQNLADSLGRVPGLAIERDQGQARFINFRGAPFRFTSIAFDGIDVPGAENGRIPRFDAFPAAITGAIAVNKAVTANMPGEAVAGFINIESFKPFDREGFHISVEGGYGRQGLGGVGIERMNGRVSYSNDVFGILAFGSRNKRGRITDNREYELQLDENGDVIPNNLDFRSYRGERVDNAYGGSIEFRPTETTRIFFSSIFSEFVDREERNQFDFDIADTPGVSAIGTPVTPNVGFQPVVVVTRLLEDGIYNNSTWTNTIGFDTEAFGWQVNGRFSYIKTNNETLLPIPFSAGGVVAASYDVTDILNPQLQVFDSAAALADGSRVPIDINSLTYPANFGLIFANDLDIDNYKVKLDFMRDASVFGASTTFQAGIQIDLRDASGGDTLLFGGFPDSVDINSFVTDTPWDTGFDNTINATNYDNVGLIDAWEAAAGGSLEVPFDEDSLIGIDENIFAAYVMGTTDFSWGNIVYGVRIEHTDFNTNGTQLIDGVANPIEASNSYTDVLPSVHININLRDNIKLRLSGTTGVSRPTYAEARASISIDAVELEVTGGNPDLEAEYAYGADISLEYYFAEASLISVGGFVRFVDNVLYADGVTLDDGSAFAPGLIAPGTPTVFNSFFNGDDGKLFGLELNFIGQATFLPGALDGFGVSANLTLLDSEFTAPTQGNAKFDLPGTSDLVLNASLFYEKYGFSARVNYQYRDDWLSTTENDGLNEFWGATTRVDASVRYTVPSKVYGTTVTLFADGNNLTDERDLRYENTPATPNQYEGFGRRFVIGARIDY
ncbi:MAG: TonB-dependent receptor [Pseudomonadota bacterium]